MLKLTGIAAAAMVAALACAAPAYAQEDEGGGSQEVAPPASGSPTFQGNVANRARNSPTAPDTPYPIEAAGWGNPSGQFFTSRWVEDWSRLKAKGKAPPLKAMPLFGHDDITLTLSGEMRLRSLMYADGGLHRGDDYHEFIFRAVAGADLHLGDHFRVYGELGHGDHAGDGHPTVNSVSASYENDLSVQQIFGEARTHIGSALVGVQGGRFEFADGPKQLISVSNGPNLHRTWNGGRFYLLTPRFRLGLFTGSVTKLGTGVFDEGVDGGEKLSAVTSSVLIRHDHGTNIFLDPAYYHRHLESGIAGITTGHDNRDTYGARLWGKYGLINFDVMGFRQTGEHMGRDVSAWMSSISGNVLLSPKGIRPRVGFRIDLASGGRTDQQRTGTVHGYDVVYQSTSYLSEGHLLGYTNLALFSPTVAFTPIKKVTVNAEYDLVRRMSQYDAFYAQGSKPYPGTAGVRGYTVGGYGRLIAEWQIKPNIAFELEGDHLSAGKVMKRAGLPSSNFLLLSLDLRY
jgi:hypothetical protein